MILKIVAVTFFLFLACTYEKVKGLLNETDVPGGHAILLATPFLDTGLSSCSTIVTATNNTTLTPQQTIFRNISSASANTLIAGSLSAHAVQPNSASTLSINTNSTHSTTNAQTSAAQINTRPALNTVQQNVRDMDILHVNFCL